MAYTTINKSTDHFTTRTYSASGAGSVSDVSFQPDFLWFKNRTIAGDHGLMDAVRGVTKILHSNDSNAEVTAPSGKDFTAFTSNGFTYGVSYELDTGSGTPCTWLWKANGTGSSNTDGSRTTTVSVNTTAGFSVGTCASLATNNDTLGHGLSAVPKMIIVKNTQATGNWFVYHASLGNTDSLYLNTNGSTLGSTIWNNTTPTSSVFTMKGGDFATGESLVFYAFAEKTGYSKFGSYVGNGSNFDNTFVYTGFKPAFIMIKRSDGGGGTAQWLLMDSKRIGYNQANYRLYPNLNNVENTTDYIDILSNGFKIRDNGNDFGASGGSYIYMAFAAAPLVGSNNVPATAR